MKLFDKTNPDHIRILREEVAKVIKEQDFTAPGKGEQLAKNDQGGRTNLRAIESKLDMDSLDPFNPNPFNRLVIKYLDIVNKDSLNDITVEQSYDLLTKLHELNAKTTTQPTQSEPKSDINPYDMPGGGRSTGYMGATYRGD
tara:strand:- start:604 stop:1029 length:426 start_codon:yes stop_codon:yes gene_type:complete